MYDINADRCPKMTFDIVSINKLKMCRVCGSTNLKLQVWDNGGIITCYDCKHSENEDAWQADNKREEALQCEVRRVQSESINIIRSYLDR